MQGPSGIVTQVSVSGLGANPTGTLQFLAPTATVTITAANQRVHITSSKYMGSTVGALDLDLWICTRLGANALVQQGGGVLDGRVPANTRVSWTLSHVQAGLANGTYTVGLCGLSSNAASWNSNEWGYTSAIVATQ